MTDATDAFVEQTLDPGAVGDRRLARALAQAYETSREVWVGTKVSAAQFARHLGKVVPDETDFVDAIEGLRTTDLFLACGCALGDAAALRAFEEKIMPRAQAATRRVDASPIFVEDVCADVRVRLLVASDGEPEIGNYLGRGPLENWVMVVAMRLALSRKRKKPREVALDLTEVVETLLADDRELKPFASQLHEPFVAAFTKALNGLSTRERNVLRLYMVDGVSAEKIGKMYRVHRSTVVRWLTAARQRVQAETRRDLMAAHLLDGTSLESVMGGMWSGFDMSLTTWLSR